MRLVQPRKEESVYVTLSDLLLTTVAIFVLLLLMVMAQVKPALPPAELERLKQQASQAKEMEQKLASSEKALAEMKALSKSKFTGGTQPTLLYVAHVKAAGRPSVALFPSDIEREISYDRTSRTLGERDPLLEICQRTVSPEGWTVLPIDDFLGLADGLTHEIQYVSMGEGTVELGILLAACEADEGLRRLSGEELRARIFGKTVDADYDHLRMPWREYCRRVVDFLQSATPGKNDFHSWMAKTIIPLRARTRPSPDGIGHLRFTAVSEGQVRVGALQMTAAQFCALLRAIAPGAGFYIEHVDATGNAMPPPAWVTEQILNPTHMNIRL